MKATTKFIEDAIAGGFAKDTVLGMRVTEVNGDNVLLREDAVTLTLRISQILLQPLAWQAVGKTRGWTAEFEIATGLVIEGRDTVMSGEIVPKWRYEMHRFIDHLADGKSIEEALEAIT
jgi:hypothetical protein